MEKMRTRYSKNITIRELCEGFSYNVLEGRGISGLSGKLVIQPSYQRSYIYESGGRDAKVIQSILRKWTIGLLYFAKVGEDRYEVLDGQQRITSIGRYVQDLFSVEDESGNPHYFTGLSKCIQDEFLDTELLICICEGTEKELMEWFSTINIVGVPLNGQELLNAIYSGPFITRLRGVYSNGKNPGMSKWRSYIKGAPERQEVLEVVIRWVSGDRASEYISMHRWDDDISEVERRFDEIIEWVGRLFPDTVKEMCGLDWGRLYATYHRHTYDYSELEAQVSRLMSDPYIRNRRGIFEYVLGGCNDKRLLDVRIFDEATKRIKYKEQSERAIAQGTSNCRMCAEGGGIKATKEWQIKEMEADHITAWSKGGLTTPDNCELLCIGHNRIKGNC
jgi:hypothetical protein